MAITTYAQLLTAAENWIERTDMDDRYPECIALAEGVANRILNCRQMYARNASFTVDSATESLPSAFAGVRAFHLNTSPITPLRYVKADAIDDTLRAADEASGRPIWYTIIGETFLFSPTPDDTYTATLVYRQNLTALSADNTTNWLLTAYPDVYLHGTLAFAYQFIEDTEMEAKFFANFTAGLEQINALDDRQAFGSSPARRVRPFS